MLVGIDFDNTIVCYDSLFHEAALERGLVPSTLSATKGHIRDYLRSEGNEDSWTDLQGYVYGVKMLDAAPFPGVLDFFSKCRELDIECCIISHRTRYPFIGEKYDLHAAAKEWIQHYGFYQYTGLSSENVYFELTSQDKLARIREKKCDIFIDDLPEFLTDCSFPPSARCILFDPNNLYRSEKRFRRACTWGHIFEIVVSEVKVH